MEQVSTILEVIFIATTIITVWQFYRASNSSKFFLLIAVLIAISQFFIGRTNFYENGNTIPPKFLLLIAPAIVFIVLLIITKQGKYFLDSINLKHLSILHTVRIPVEIVLYYLFVAKTIPQIMTFEGKNFDIIAGLTAPIIYYFDFVKNRISTTLILAWNILSLGLLLNIVFIAILSTTTPFQKFGFDQPNIAIAHFPFNWLPSIIVPLVLLSHLTTIRQLLLRKKKNNS